ncbi:transposase [Acinetobacter tianfuensis]|uniref:Transposase n=1 Tax=Acinetobacter tianfuensis TaxID=2419603 RepID=A0A3A8EHL8_9GAMM|nr:transposase [Acinetobacter tianfuensis]RKG34075.1 transposase [Acinetobacter tianfuensis]
MKKLSEWLTASQANGGQIKVKLVPMQRQQNTPQGFIWVDVGQMIELETGETFNFNVDGKSFYTGFNQLYRLA